LTIEDSLQLAAGSFNQTDEHAAVTMVGILLAKLVKNENPLFTIPLVNRCFTRGERQLLVGQRKCEIDEL
jgi:hypothetical protein